jgi:hypothetical protein
MKKDTVGEWLDLVTPSCNKLMEKNDHWAQLKPRDQELAALERLQLSFNTAGYLQFFTLHGFKAYEHVLRALKKIGANVHLEDIQKVYSIIKKLENKKEFPTRWDIEELLTEEEINQIEEMNHWKRIEMNNIFLLTLEVYK